MKAILLLLATSAAAAPCPTPTLHVYKTLAAAKAAMKSEPMASAPELENQGTAFFADVPMGSKEGDDATRYRVDAILVRKRDVVVVDDLARWVNVIPPPGHRSPTSPAKSIRVDGNVAQLQITGYRDLRVDIAAAKSLGCAN